MMPSSVHINRFQYNMDALTNVMIIMVIFQVSLFIKGYFGKCLEYVDTSINRIYIYI